ncbi:MAG: CBS domain-containing protein [Deltaproteobacteria bacterium]|nr:CBS domain-containing protein [Deltaproteobacteria bacterium]MBW2224756.1 CBS domain-containing protein [Deltaproteobacteria bacterium]MBW2546408.1 CBS domain-containing protein [Deltaproteobacteria bacterium]
MNTRIRDILRRKGEDVYSVGPLATVIDAVHMMNDHHVGSVLVCEGGDPVGVFSERDVLVRVVAAQRDPRQTLVRDVMTTRLHTATPDDTLLDVMRLMTERRCRHVPVMEGGRLLGMVSIGDLTKETQRNLHQEVRELSSYIGGPYLS